jgi:hypothetical protein
MSTEDALFNPCSEVSVALVLMNSNILPEELYLTECVSCKVLCLLFTVAYAFLEMWYVGNNAFDDISQYKIIHIELS